MGLLKWIIILAICAFLYFALGLPSPIKIVATFLKNLGYLTSLPPSP